VQCGAYFYRSEHAFSTMFLVLAALALLVAAAVLVPRDQPEQLRGGPKQDRVSLHQADPCILLHLND
jgi:hypothetical protein